MVTIECFLSNKPRRQYSICELKGLAKLLAFNQSGFCGFVLNSVDIDDNYAVFITVPYTRYVNDVNLMLSFACLKEALDIDEIYVRVRLTEWQTGPVLPLPEMSYEFVVDDETIKSLPSPTALTLNVGNSVTLCRLAMIDPYYRVGVLSLLCKSIDFVEDYVYSFQALSALYPSFADVYVPRVRFQMTEQYKQLDARIAKDVLAVMEGKANDVSKESLRDFLEWTDRKHKPITLEELGCGTVDESDIVTEFDDLLYPDREFVRRLKSDSKLKERVRLLYALQ